MLRSTVLRWCVGLAIALSGCGSDHDGREAAECRAGSAVAAACDCPDGTTGVGSRDVCTGKLVGTCACAQRVDCELWEFACAASQRCLSDDCEPCACNPPTVENVVPLVGPPVVSMTSDRDGGVVLLLGAEPWLARIKVDGTISPLKVQASLAWAGYVWVTPQGSIVALGNRADRPSIQFQRFDPEGTLVGSGTWSLDGDAGTLRGVAAQPDDRLAVLAASDHQIGIGVLDAEKDRIDLVHSTDFSSDPFAHGKCCGRQPSAFTVDSRGNYYAAGSFEPRDRIDGAWRASFDPAGKPVAEVVEEGFDLYSTEPLLASSAAGVFEAWTWHVTDRSPFDSYFARLSPTATTYWQNNSMDQGLGGSSVSALVALPDGMLAAGTASNADVLLRFDAHGASIRLPIRLDSRPQQLVEVSDYRVAVLEAGSGTASYRIHWITLEPLKQRLGTPGEACTEAGECESGLCCFSAAGASGACGEHDGCAMGFSCERDSDCAGGACLAGAGVCAAKCQASADCPKNTFCSTRCFSDDCETVCLPDCTTKGSAACSSFGGTTCSQTSNVENVKVSLCL